MTTWKIAVAAMLTLAGIAKVAMAAYPVKVSSSWGFTDIQVNTVNSVGVWNVMYSGIDKASLSHPASTLKLTVNAGFYLNAAGENVTGEFALTGSRRVPTCSETGLEALRTMTRGTLDYATNACCNRTLPFDTCCERQNTLVPKTFMKNATMSALTAMCENPGRVANLLRDYIKPRDLIESYDAFRDECSDEIYNKKCNANSDCWEGTTCNTDWSPSTCRVPYGSEYSMLVDCYYEKMAVKLKENLSKRWQLPLERSVFVAKITELVVIEDCVGDSADAAGSSTPRRGSTRSNNERAMLRASAVIIC